MCWGKKNLIFYAFFIVSIILFFVTITQANKKVQIKEKIVNTDPNLRDILVIKKHKKMLISEIIFIHPTQNISMVTSAVIRRQLTSVL